MRRGRPSEPARRRWCGGARPGWPGRCWPMVGASVAALVVLSVANGNFQREPLANTVGLLLAFAAFMGVGRPDRGQPARQRHRLGLLGHRPAGGDRRPGRGVRRLRGPDPARAPARRGAGRLVRRLGLVPDGRAGAGVHAPAVPRRPAAVASLAAGRLARRGGDGAVRRPRRRPADHRAGRRPRGRQPDRGRRGRGPRGQPPQRRAGPAGRPGRGGVAGRPVPPLPGRGAPPAQVVHLRRRPAARWSCWATSCPTRSATCCSPSGSRSCRSPPGSRSCATGCTTSTG